MMGASYAEVGQIHEAKSMMPGAARRIRQMVPARQMISPAFSQGAEHRCHERCSYTLPMPPGKYKEQIQKRTTGALRH